jgi:2'-5' RNA ligase
MNGVVSLLPQPQYDQVQQLWKDLEMRFGIQSTMVGQYPPHISWLTINDFPLKNLETEFRSLAAKINPFTIRTSGIGVFTHPKPVIYISVIKNDTLNFFHHQIWEIGQTYIPVNQVFQLYSPKLWQPHITLVNIDPAPENLGEILAVLSFSPFQWEMTIDHLAFLCPQTGKPDSHLCRIPLGKE